ncbi:MAG: hypothetical protein ACYTGB_19950, partial [Planctomycetota bacterium]
KRPRPELRGLVQPAGKVNMGRFKLKDYVGQQGIDEMKKLGVEMNPKTGELSDTKKDRKWFPVVSPHTWMFTYQSAAMECYYRLTGDEDMHDNCIAYGQGVGRVLFQPIHYNLFYGRLLVDFPVRGVAKDPASWTCPPGVKYAEGIKINGYLATFHPDVCARAYSLSGEKLLKQRAYDYWWGGSHRGYNSPKMRNLGAVAAWVNINSDHNEYVNMTGRTFYEWSHPRKDELPPAAVTDLKVSGAGEKVTVSFTAPADAGGGKVVRYQVKCSDRNIVDYEAFLPIYNDHKEAENCNWFLAANVKGEAQPKAAGAKESFTVSGVPQKAKFFAVRAFDDSSNRSAISNVFAR